MTKQARLALIKQRHIHILASSWLRLHGYENPAAISAAAGRMRCLRMDEQRRRRVAALVCTYCGDDGHGARGCAKRRRDKGRVKAARHDPGRIRFWVSDAYRRAITPLSKWPKQSTEGFDADEDRRSEALECWPVGARGWG